MVFFAVLLSLLAATSKVHASCECGFSMSDTKDYFTHVIYNNFTAFSPSKNLRTNPDFTKDWEVQNWGVPPRSWVKPLAIDNMEENVFLREGNLILRQQGYSKEDALTKSKVRVASIASQRDDIIHGSFRVELKMENAKGGSCGAFFWYRDDENEIDIEILSREFKTDWFPVHYTTHPALDEHGQVISNATKVIPLRDDDILNSFQRHRFDWTRDELRFYQNSTQVHSNALRIPYAPGHAYLNVWADGGPWSGAPSTTDVFLTVKLIAIYHNTSASDRGLDKEFNERCKKAGGPSNLTICLDTSVESGTIDPSSSASMVVPLRLWILSLLCVAFAIVVSAV
ncbi:hypothetical protein AJ78_02288 [Emergomyces pasteurianus Ep9510]|uniref:GH16 domain-containing protein n=1 Tax=Emergomyces pasteurianus Ep9510 TaxID=1447872 RepID=A0A1J9PNC1_9EURO|nr:hypothetical protein AJ78_02288 [Emergomyces pasteurianus Ep9510]